jgi:predicted Zn-dependent protease
MFWFLWLALIISLPVMSHQTSRTATSKELKWNYTNVPIRITNPSSTLSTANNIIDESLAEWNNASAFQFQRGTTGVNQIVFSNNFSMYGSAVVGLTELGYSNTGTINSARVLLNEQDYIFVDTPGIAYSNYIYLKDVVSHELGHFIGLGHSEVLNSTMFYQTYPGQAELSPDDIAGARTKYNTGLGKISGYIKGGSHIGILGVHTDFCPTSYVASFFSQCGNQFDGIAQGITLTSSQKSIDVGEVSINCTLRAQESYLQQKISTTFSSVEIYNYAQDLKYEKTYTGYFNLSDLNDSTFSAADKFTIDLSSLPSPIGKNLKIRLISQGFGNPVDYNVVIRKNGYDISGSPFGRTFNPEGTIKLDVDAAIALNSAATNTFEVEISARKLSPIGTRFSIPDAAHFASIQTTPYLLIMSVETGSEPVLDTGLLLSDNSSCLDAPFTYAVANSTAKTDETKSGGGASASAGAACGTIDPPSGPGPGSFMGIMSLGFMLSALAVIFVKRGKNFLS